MSDAVEYFDNLKIVKVKADSFGILAEDIYDDVNYVDVKFTKDVLKTAKFYVDDDAVSEENVSWINQNTARIKTSGLDLGEHKISVDAKDFLGNGAKFDTAEFEILSSKEKYVLYFYFTPKFL